MNAECYPLEPLVIYTKLCLGLHPIICESLEPLSVPSGEIQYTYLGLHPVML
jgi:hypothetical protein